LVEKSIKHKLGVSKKLNGWQLHGRWLKSLTLQKTSLLSDAAISFPSQTKPDTTFPISLKRLSSTSAGAHPKQIRGIIIVLSLSGPASATWHVARTFVVKKQNGVDRITVHTLHRRETD